MWIRSQDKRTMIKADYVSVLGKNIYAGSPIEGEVLGNYGVGTYETEGRAMEVLDEIQVRIMKGTQFDEIYDGKRTTKEFVYQMPEV